MTDPGPGTTHRWDGRTLGGVWLFKACIAVLPWIGVTGARIGSYIIATGFLMGGGRFQFGSLIYWRRVAPRAGVIVHWMRTWRRYASFGRILCDRLLANLRMDKYTFVYSDGDLLRRTVTSGKGTILLAAHLGNWELSGLRLTKMATGKVNLVMVRNDDSYMQQFVDERLNTRGVNVIDPRDPLGASLAIHGALQRGEVVCMLGDRVFGEQPSCRVQFFGRSARFPLGPFHAAAITGAPIVVCFLMQEGDREYHLHIDQPIFINAPRRGPQRRAALEAAAQAWATRLERQVRRYPMQWHNFFDFWE